MTAATAYAGVLAPAAPAPSLAAPAAGRSGSTLTSKTAGGAATLIGDPERRDGRLSIRVVAANFDAVPQPFGLEAVALTLDRTPLRLAATADLVARQPGCSARDSKLARVAAAPVIAGFGQRDTTQDDTPGGSRGAMPGERYARPKRSADTDPAHTLRGALLATLLAASDVTRHPVKRTARSLDVAVTFADAIHRFQVGSAAR